MYTQLVNNLDELGFTDVEPYLSEYLTTATKDGISLQEALYEISKREISLRNQRAAQIQVSVSHFPYIKTIDEFDFHFQNTVSSLAVLLHQHCMRCFAAQCLNTDGSASAEQIKEMTFVNILRQHIKQGLFDSVGCRTSIHSFHPLQLYTPCLTCNHSHVITSCSFITPSS